MSRTSAPGIPVMLCTLALELVLAASACGSDVAESGLPEPVAGTDPTATESVEVGEERPVRLEGPLRYTVIESYHHDDGAFTQGLEIVDGDLFESTGLYGRSELRRVDLETGQVIDGVSLDNDVFGEGLTGRRGLLYQLTWKAGRVLVVDASTLDRAPGIDLVYDGRGWGLCSTANEVDEPFVMSDGSARLTIRDPETFAVRRAIEVTDADGNAVSSLNELECVGDQVLANIWKSNRIVAIDLSSGEISAELDLTALVPEVAEPKRAVLNGIAYRPNTGTYLVTGKLWPTMFEITLEPADP